MPLPIPNLYRPFAQIAEEGRALIPSSAPEWTDHNVHDPGITFVELFAWLAEIQHYRLNRTSAASFARFFALAGLTPHVRRAAEVAVHFEFEGLTDGLLVPANTLLTAVGHDDVPFQTIRDTYLAPARLRKVVTHAGGRAVQQTEAQENEAGHFEAFGASPREGDALHLGFEGWFKGDQGHLAFTMFEGDLPARQPFAPAAEGFVPSARVRWDYRTSGGWAELPVVEDGTLQLSRSGELIFRNPEPPPQLVVTNESGEKKGLYWLRVVLVGGHFEIPPRVSRIRTNTVRARQVETRVDEDLGPGLGTPDQLVRLKKYPVLLDAEIGGARFEAGEVLDWNALVRRLARAKELPAPARAGEPLDPERVVKYVADKLSEASGSKDLFDNKRPGDEEKYRLAQAFDRLLDRPDFYQRDLFGGISVPQEFSEQEAGRACENAGHTRRFNRFLLRRVFPDLFVSDRVEIQTGKPDSPLEDEAKSWLSWERVDDFSRSGPEDRHYRLEPQTGRILFGNGLNGRVPQEGEFIRARFYRHTRAAEGNLTAGLQWQLGGPDLPAGVLTRQRTNPEPAAGGAEPESLDDAKARSRAVFRKQKPTLTAGDYEAQALDTPGLRVARAKVVANFNPNLPKLGLPGEVTVVVLPQPAPPSAFPDAPPPKPSKGFLDTVRNHLEARRLVATNVHVVAPRFVPVAVSGRVFLKKGASADETTKAIKKALADFLDPVRGGPDKKGWPFGRPVFPSEISQQVASVAGVDYVTGVVLNGLEAGRPVKLRYNGLPVGGAHRLTPIPFEQRGQIASAEQRGRDAGDCGKGACRD